MRARIKSQNKSRSKRITFYDVDLPREATILETPYYIRLIPLGLDTSGKTYSMFKTNGVRNSVSFATDIDDGVYEVEVVDGEIYINT